MPKVSGIFGQFNNLDKIPLEDILRWLRPAPQPIILQNYIANRIIYPQSVPISPQELKIELAILREALKEKNYLNISSKRLFIPEDFIQRFPNLTELIWVFIDAYFTDRKEEGVFRIISKGGNEQYLGSLIIPNISTQPSQIEVGVDDKIYDFKLSGLSVIPCSKSKCTFFYRIKGGTLLGKDVGKIEIYGGKAGVVIDGRPR